MIGHSVLTNYTLSSPWSLKHCKIFSKFAIDMPSLFFKTLRVDWQGLYFISSLHSRTFLLRNFQWDEEDTLLTFFLKYLFIQCLTIDMREHYWKMQNHEGKRMLLSMVSLSSTPNMPFSHSTWYSLPWLKQDTFLPYIPHGIGPEILPVLAL